MKTDNNEEQQEEDSEDRRPKKVRYPWLREAFAIASQLLPLPVDDLKTALSRKLTPRAVQALVGIDGCRWRAATMTVNVMKRNRSIEIVDGIVSRHPLYRGVSTAADVLDQLKLKKSLLESEVAEIGRFTKSTVSNYRKELIWIEWIKVTELTYGGIMWNWIGPEDAEWATVHRARKSRLSKNQSTKKQ
jgi:hypothetical protein